MGQPLTDHPPMPSSPPDPLDINPSVDFLFDCGLVGPEDVSADQDLPRAIRKVSSPCGLPTTGSLVHLHVTEALAGLLVHQKDLGEGETELLVQLTGGGGGEAVEVLLPYVERVYWVEFMERTAVGRKQLEGGNGVSEGGSCSEQELLSRGLC